MSLDEAVAISAALGTNPVHMIVDPNRDEPINLAPDLSVWPDDARSWLSGLGALRDEDTVTYYTEVSAKELRRQFDVQLSLLMHLLQSVVDAVIESAEDLDDAALNTIADRIDALSRELDLRRQRNRELDLQPQPNRGTRDLRQQQKKADQ